MLRNHHRFKKRPSGGFGKPKVGDWVIYGPPDGQTGGHVDVVVSVDGTRTITVVGGNVSDQATMRTRDPRTARSGTGGYLISGYVTPPGAG